MHGLIKLTGKREILGSAIFNFFFVLKVRQKVIYWRLSNTKDKFNAFQKHRDENWKHDAWESGSGFLKDHQIPLGNSQTTVLSQNHYVTLIEISSSYFEGVQKVIY